jgi:hypothetical protein
VQEANVNARNLLRMADFGSQVRVADGLPSLLVVDAARVAVLVSTSAGLRVGWSRDALHVAAAQDLFERWWGAAEPFYEKEYVPPDESDLVVEEWDEEFAREMPEAWAAEKSRVEWQARWRREPVEDGQGQGSPGTPGPGRPERS